MVFFKMAMGNLGRRKGRTFLSILAIALSGALLTGITLLSNSYTTSFENGISEMLGYTDIGVGRYMNQSSGLFTEQEIVPSLELQNIDGYINHTTRFQSYQEFTTFENTVQRYAFSTLFMGIDPISDRGFGYVEILEYSSEFTNPTTIEDIIATNSSYLVISTWVSNVFNLTIDDEVLVLSKNTTRAHAGLVNPLNSSTWDRFYVKAIVNDYAEGELVGYNTQLNESYHSLNGRMIYLDISIATQIANISTDRRNILYIGVKLGDLSSANSYVESHLPVGFYSVNIKADRLTAVRNSIESMLMILAILTMISVIVAVMLITNTLLMNIQEQKYETSVLRAMGVFKDEVFQLFFSQALILALIGSILGAGLGMGMAPLLKRFFFNKLAADAAFTLRIYYNWEDIVYPSLINFVITACVGMFPAYLSTKLQIIEALRNLPPSKPESRFRKILAPLIGCVVLGFSYWYLQNHQRELLPSLIGIIPFILAILVVTTLIVPLFVKLFSYLMSWLLGSFRQLTERYMGQGENRKKSNVTFMMFATSIAFLVMVSNVLVSMERIQINAIPRYLGNDLVIYSEGSTFGMDDLLMNDTAIIQGRVNNASLFTGLRAKINGYGQWPNLKQKEPSITTYIIEPLKFEAVNSELTMFQPKGSPSRHEIFTRLENEDRKIILTKQLADAQHLNIEVGQNVTVDLHINQNFTFEVIGIVDFVAGFSETWEEPSEVLPAATSGKYAAWISWSTANKFIDSIFENLPDLHIAIKGDNHDPDYWDFPLINATVVRQLLQQYENRGLLTMAERVWDWNATTLVSSSQYNTSYLLNAYQTNPTLLNNISDNVHMVFQNTTVDGQTVFIKRRSTSYRTVQDALKSGQNQCVITKDIANSLGFDIDDNITLWHQNMTWKTGDAAETVVFSKNFTIAAIVDINGTLEAFNFDAVNPYVEGNNDVAADDSTCVLVDNTDLEFQYNILNHTLVYEFWLELTNYYQDHLWLNKELRTVLGPDYVTMDYKWLYTSEFAYAPAWIIDLNPQYDQEDAIERVKQYLLMNQMPVIGWRSSEELAAQYRDQIEFQKAFFNVVLSFALIIAVLGIMINMLMAIAGRAREIGILRALGTQKSEVLRMVVGETFTLTFTGLILGTAVGTACAWMMLHGLPLDTVFQILLKIDWMTIGIISIIVVIISILASLFPARNAIQINVIEAIRDQ